MRYRHIFSILVLVTAAVSGAETEPAQPLLTILYTGETHAALLPCDCPLQPIGGVARRATAIARYRQRGPVLLLDAGAWAAGGIYDEESDGDPQRDLLRTQLTVKAMRAMKYDVALPGPLEAESINDEKLWPARLLRPQQTLEVPSKLGLPIYVTGWVEPGATLFGLVAPQPPKVWPRPADLPEKTFDIHLSRLGEEGSEVLARATGADLIINAGRKVSQRIAWKLGRTTVANFDYQAQRLGVIEIYPPKEAAQPGARPQFDIRVRFETLVPDVRDDPEMAALLKPHLENLKKRGKKRIELELWTMPECPGCFQAVPMVHEILTGLASRVDVSVHYVVHKEDGKLGALHGERELNEARVQALIRKHYPDQLWLWLLWRLEQRQAAWETGAAKFGLLPARIRGGLASGEADALLEADLELMQRRRVEGTPSLVISNRLYDGPLEKLQVLRVLCSLLDAPKPDACKDVPACFYDAQCRKRGFIGRCIDPGKPTARCDTSQPALKVPGIVITDRENIYDKHERILEVLLGDLPGLDYRVLDLSDPEARELLEKGKLTRLPAYILDPIAKKEAGYDETVGKAAQQNDALGKLNLNPFAVGSHRLLRPRLKGRADLFVARLGRSGQDAVETALEFAATMGPAAPEIVFHDALYWKETRGLPAEGGERTAPKRELAAVNGLPELEEAARALAVRKLAPEKFNSYLLERGKRRGSSYWDVALKNLGIDPAAVRALAEGPSEEILKAMQAEADLLSAIDGGGDITFLAENCEIIPLRSRQDLRQMLERIAQRKAERQ